MRLRGFERQVEFTSLQSSFSFWPITQKRTTKKVICHTGKAPCLHCMSTEQNWSFPDAYVDQSPTFHCPVRPSTVSSYLENNNSNKEDKKERRTTSGNRPRACAPPCLFNFKIAKYCLKKNIVWVLFEKGHCLNIFWTLFEEECCLNVVWGMKRKRPEKQ